MRKDDRKTRCSVLGWKSIVPRCCGCCYCCWRRGAQSAIGRKSRPQSVQDGPGRRLGEMAPDERTNADRRRLVVVVAVGGGAGRIRMQRGLLAVVLPTRATPGAAPANCRRSHDQRLGAASAIIRHRGTADSSINAPPCTPLQNTPFRLHRSIMHRDDWNCLLLIIWWKHIKNAGHYRCTSNVEYAVDF